MTDNQNKMNNERMRMTIWSRMRVPPLWRLILFGFLCALPGPPVWAGWGMNDATIVYPLPQSETDMSHVLGPQDQGPGGALLPQKYWQRIPPINQGESASRTYRNLRVVAVRLDPCFRSRGHCQPQVRFVWQPIDRAVYGSASPFGLEAKDAAVHTFYALEPSIFRQFISEYDLLSRVSPATGAAAPLQVHPVIRQQGLDGAFSQGLKQLLLKFCGEANLWRVTSMSSLVGGDKWEFSGFNIMNGEPVDIVIPRTGNATKQSFSVSLGSGRDYRDGRISPSPGGEDNLNALLRDSLMLGTKDSSVLEILGESVARIENPDIHNPDSMDCVSCHSTQAAGTLLFGRVPWLRSDQQVLKHAYRSVSPLQNMAATRGSPRVFRALGYFEKSPVLSRRVINETAAAVALLNSEMPRRDSVPNTAADNRLPRPNDANGYENPSGDWVLGETRQAHPVDSGRAL
jgi:hypothetical protein